MTQQEKEQIQTLVSNIKNATEQRPVRASDLGNVLEKIVAAVDKAAQLAEANSLPNYAGLVMRGITIYSDRVSYYPSSSGRAPETAVPAVATFMGHDTFSIGLYDYSTGIFHNYDHNGNQFFMTNNALILHTNKEVYFLKEDPSTPNSYYLYGLGGNKVTINSGNADVYLPQE